MRRGAVADHGSILLCSINENKERKLKLSSETKNDIKI